VITASIEDKTLHRSESNGWRWLIAALKKISRSLSRKTAISLHFPRLGKEKLHSISLGTQRFICFPFLLRNRLKGPVILLGSFKKKCLRGPCCGLQAIPPFNKESFAPVIYREYFRITGQFCFSFFPFSMMYISLFFTFSIAFYISSFFHFFIISPPFNIFLLIWMGVFSIIYILERPNKGK
jgi:hypothetical protein